MSLCYLCVLLAGTRNLLWWKTRKYTRLSIELEDHDGEVRYANYSSFQVSGKLSTLDVSYSLVKKRE